MVAVAVSGSSREIRPALKGINEPTQGCSELLIYLMLITSAGPARIGTARICISITTGLEGVS